MGIGLRTDVVELDDVAALEAALNGALTGDLLLSLAMTTGLNDVRDNLTVNQLTMWESAG